MILGKDNIERLPPPIGTSDWATFSRDSYCVDKTLILKDLIDSRSRVVLMVKTLEALLAGETSRVAMAKDLGPYRDIVKSKASLYALLVSAGYLKVASPIEEGRCRVAIPNHEIAQVFVSDIKAKIDNVLEVGTGDIVDALLDRDPAALKEAISSLTILIPD